MEDPQPGSSNRGNALVLPENGWKVLLYYAERSEAPLPIEIDPRCVQDDTMRQVPQVGGLGMYEDALRFSLVLRSIALRMMAPMTIGPVQKRLKPNVKKAIKIDIMSKGK